MHIGYRGVLTTAAAFAIVAAACSSSTASTSPTTAPSTAASAAASAAPSTDMSGLPYTAKLKDGSTFKLAASIVAKLQAKQPINYVFDYGSTSIPLFSPQYLNGYNQSLPEAQKILPMNGQAVAPSSAVQDPNEQISQIQALVNAGQVDCLSIQSTGLDTFTKITNDIMAKGIPVFTVGVQSNGNEFTNYTQISDKEGHQAAQIVIDWMKANGKSLTTFAVSGGDPTQNWAQGRMQGFIDGIKAGVPGAKFLNSASNALTTSYDPAGTYSAYKAFIQGNPDVQFIENVDIGAEHADRAIKDANLTGKVFTIGWNVSIGQLDAVKAGTQVAALDQQWGKQAGFGALACANFLGKGVILPNDQVLLPVTQANEAQARADFLKLTGG
jgi:ABC-type sugar transport system substrate-binding protein